MEAVGSAFTNKYAEGRPGRRYYSGCGPSDEVEELAAARARKMFRTDYHCNVQPHSGTQANLAVLLSVVKPGDGVLAMDLAMGGHLSHGSPLNQTGKLYRTHFYGVDRASERIDYDAVARIAEEARPRLIIAGASAYPRTIDFARFGEIARSVGALLLADIAHIAGLVAADLHPTPFGHADFVSTTTHKTLRGPRGGMVLCREEHRKALDLAVFPGLQGGPLVHAIAGKAVAFGEALHPSFRAYQAQVVANCSALGDELKKRGRRIVSGGTDNHLLLVDLCGAPTGAEAQTALEKRRVFVNRNLIPYDTRSPMVTSGLRLGAAAMTARGLREADFREIGRVTDDIVSGRDDAIDARVAALCEPR
jgi:glycine hydroxymethyltransferase